MNWHNIDTQKVFELTGSSPQGLSLHSVEAKQIEHGKNQLLVKKKKSAWLMFFNQFKDFMIIVLIAAAIISGLMGDVTDTIIILIIILLNSILGFVQEYRAEKALEALKKLVALNATVIREEKVTTIPSEELVPGDLVILESGNIAPADIRLYEAHSVRADESSLTGESVSVDKVSDTLHDQDLSLGDRFNMLYKGTLITSGRATGIVVETGMNTEIGQIASLLEQNETATPLQIRMTDFGKKFRISFCLFALYFLVWVC